MAQESRKDTWKDFKYTFKLLACLYYEDNIDDKRKFYKNLVF